MKISTASGSTVLNASPRRSVGRPRKVSSTYTWFAALNRRQPTKIRLTVSARVSEKSPDSYSRLPGISSTMCTRKCHSSRSTRSKRPVPIELRRSSTTSTSTQAISSLHCCPRTVRPSMMSINESRSFSPYPLTVSFG